MYSHHFQFEFKQHKKNIKCGRISFEQPAEEWSKRYIKCNKTTE